MKTKHWFKYMLFFICFVIIIEYLLYFHYLPIYKPTSYICETTLPTSENPFDDNIEYQIFKIWDLINDIRSEQNLISLDINEELNKFAEIRAKECSEYWSHVRPNGEMGVNLISDSKWRGENLARNYYVADKIVDAWVNSPTHYDNLIFEEFTQCGICCYKNEFGENYWCILFSS